MSTLTTPRQLVDCFLRFYEAQVLAGETKQKTVDYYRHQLEKWLRTIPDGLPLDGLRPFHACKGGESWHDVQSVQRLFNWAVRLGYLNESPFSKLQRPPLGQRERVLNRGDLASLIRHLGRPHRRFVVFMRRALARPGEIRELRWRDYDVDTRLLCLKSFKAKKRRKDGVAVRAIPVDCYLQRMLCRWRIRRSPASDQFIFTGIHGKPYTGSAIRAAIRHAAKGARLVKDGEEAIVPYTLRHTAATFATKAGVRDRVLATIMGHTSTRTTARYQHLDVAELGGAIEIATGRHRDKAKP